MGLLNSDQSNLKIGKRKRWKIIVVVVIVALIIFRLILPTIVLNYVNKKLNELAEYTGRVEDIDLALIRGAYVIRDIKLEKRIEKKGKKDTIPFFTSPKIDLSVEWRAIFKGAIVGKIRVENPVLNFVKGKHKGENVKQDTADFRQLIKDLMPLTINRFDIINGEIHYIDQNSKPRVDIFLHNLNAEATNITNVNDSSKLLPAHAEMTCNMYDGEFNMKVDFDGLNKVPTFDMNAELKGMNLVKLNDFLKAYGNFDVKKGRFGLYAEFAAKDREFGGYVKPILKDLDIVQWNKEEGDIPQIIWETIVGSAAEVLQNQSKDQLATKIPINGRFEDPNIDVWKAISNVLRNAFVAALKPSIDKTINITKLEEEPKKTFFEKIFGGKKDESKENKKEKKNESKKDKK